MYSHGRYTQAYSRYPQYRGDTKYYFTKQDENNQQGYDILRIDHDDRGRSSGTDDKSRYGRYERESMYDEDLGRDRKSYKREPRVHVVVEHWSG